MLPDLLEKYEVILASGSPRRQQLLREMGITFKVVVRSVEEKAEAGQSPEEVAKALCCLKMSAFTKEDFRPNTLIITADTVVALGREVLGKPANRAEAVQLLKKLSGRCHKVITGVCLKTAGKERSFTSVTKVCFNTLTAEEIAYYVDNFKPYDKAGAYGIQEWIGHAAVERIEGSYFNVMGLPTHRLYVELRDFLRQ